MDHTPGHTPGTFLRTRLLRTLIAGDAVIMNAQGVRYEGRPPDAEIHGPRALLHADWEAAEEYFGAQAARWDPKTLVTGMDSALGRSCHASGTDRLRPSSGRSRCLETSGSSNFRWRKDAVPSVRIRRMTRWFRPAHRPPTTRSLVSQPRPLGSRRPAAGRDLEHWTRARRMIEEGRTEIAPAQGVTPAPEDPAPSEPARGGPRRSPGSRVATGSPGGGPPPRGEAGAGIRNLGAAQSRTHAPYDCGRPCRGAERRGRGGRRRER